MEIHTLFLDRKGDPTNNAILIDTGNNFTDALASKLKHLIKFSERRNDKWFCRFAAHPRFAYWAYNILYRRRILGQGSYFLKQNPSEANLTLDNLKEMLLSNSHNSLMSKLVHYGKNVSGTNAYWSQAREDLKTIIHQKGPPTVFWNLSCSDFHWPEFHQLLTGDADIGNTERTVTAKSLKLSHNLSEDLSKKQLIIKEGQDAEKTICQYVDSILTTVNPCNPDDGHWEKPLTHSCKKDLMIYLKVDGKKIMKISKFSTEAFMVFITPG